MTYKCLNFSAPPYLSDLVKGYIALHNLRFVSGHHLLDVGCNLRNYGFRSFVVPSAQLWNYMPLEIRSRDNLNDPMKLRRPYQGQSVYCIIIL